MSSSVELVNISNGYYSGWLEYELIYMKIRPYMYHGLNNVHNTCMV